MNHDRQQGIFGTSKHVTGGFAVVVAILGESMILLIKETTKPQPHFWKLIGETGEPGEPILNCLWGGVREEAGLELNARRLDNGQVVEITDSRILMAKQLLSPKWIEKPHIPGYRPHKRHFWGLLTTDAVVQSLSRQHLQGDKNEEIDTCAFDMREVMDMVDFLPDHRKLIEELHSKNQTQNQPAVA